ncbi:MAG: hypothetical protein GTO45_29790 [Candidatus Aminicenantes bacterium]|nr:hypothetical protein [Candidatus Aminicenantes bacterium]NIM82986.1 hypothetical protein [Candidatus Aminicenantes bacterium]NIN22372.1 hypothetical protein [Candidatus Aminicenantes bacterium]NIN46132.1 hypothetical protein [Candidatus Aminicenantes bacterium]NIN88968.1 hypothetical protein [Candidatus Aminicenantes bacterium]
MEKRKHKRFKTRQIAKICGKLGVVNNVSDSGIQISTALSPKNRKIDISFETNNGGNIQLMGIIQWVKWKKKLQSLNQMGVYIKDAPSEYLQFVKECNK